MRLELLNAQDFLICWVHALALGRLAGLSVGFEALTLQKGLPRGLSLNPKP